ncbi:CdaR family protein [Fluviispira multicolorata]|uniref:YbbR-like protein n=1 Tax=Fluviispira multicolorata TaxID=2654512 RepID=A0A833JDH9_9BACT|nr:CdaR family protein [Fluviispira multicolorata]KAB8031784.1 hypothetical protein GCL57_03855 [Fluviispira multicolorata]
MPTGSQEQTSIIKLLIKIIVNNFWLKVLSVVFAIVLFSIVRTDKDMSFEKVAKIKLVTSPSMIILGASERTVDVTIKHHNSLFSVTPTDTELTGEIDILSETPGRVRVKITKDSFPNLPKHYAVFIDRPFIDVDIDKLQEKIIPIQAVLKGEPQAGLTIDKVTVSPDQIKVTGARQELIRTQGLFTIPIIIEGIKNTLSTEANIELEENSSLTAAEKNVRVTVSLSPRKYNRTFRSVPIEFKGHSKNIISKLQIRPRAVDIEVSGKKDILKNLDPSDVRVFLDTSDLETGWQDKRIILKIPDNITLVKMNPDTISVHLNP